MVEFSYRAKRGPKETVEGIIEAATRQAAVSQLIDSGLSPIRVEVKKEATLPSGRREFWRRRISSQEVNIFTRQLASLIRARVELLRSLNILYAQAENLHLREVILKVHEFIKKGGSFSSALSNFPRLFPALYVSLVKSGEASGRLDEALEELAEFIDKEDEVKSKVRSALAYPALMIMVGIATVFVLVSFVIPKLAGMFADFGQVLPLPTQILINVSNIFAHYWLWLLVGAGVIIILVSKRGITPGEKLVIDKIKLRLPLIGGIIKKEIIVRFARTLALLLRSGIPVFQALEVTVPIMGNEVFVHELKSVRKEVIDGSSLAASMKKKLCFPSFLTNMVGVGEESGRLDEVLTQVASAYSREVDSKVKVITSLLEPAIILVLGLVVGFIVLAMLLPILQLTLLVK